MDEKNEDIYFLNPTNEFVNKVRTEFINKGYIESRHGLFKDTVVFKKHNQRIQISFCRDRIGTFIILRSEGIELKDLKEQLSVCPECGSDNLRILLPFCWSNQEVMNLYKKAKVDFLPGAYDRFGTATYTLVLECECKWHNGAYMSLWSEILKE